MAYWRGSTTPLKASATWTSQVGMRERHDTINGTVASDVAGTLHIQQSTDGTNWDVDATYSITGGDGKGFTELLVAPYWRIYYVNGGADQGYFRISATTQSGGDS